MLLRTCLSPSFSSFWKPPGRRCDWGDWSGRNKILQRKVNQRYHSKVYVGGVPPPPPPPPWQRYWLVSLCLRPRIRDILARCMSMEYRLDKGTSTLSQSSQKSEIQQGVCRWNTVWTKALVLLYLQPRITDWEIQQGVCRGSTVWTRYFICLTLSPAKNQRHSKVYYSVGGVPSEQRYLSYLVTGQESETHSKSGQRYLSYLVSGQETPTQQGVIRGIPPPPPPLTPTRRAMCHCRVCAACVRVCVCVCVCVCALCVCVCVCVSVCVCQCQL